MLAREFCFAHGARDVASGGSVQNKVVSGAVINTEGTCFGFQTLIDQLGTVALGGNIPQIRHELPLIRAKNAFYLFVECINIEGGNIRGQKCADNCH